MPELQELETLELLSDKAKAATNPVDRAKLGHHEVGLGFAISGLRQLLIASGVLGEAIAHEKGELESALNDLVNTKDPSAVSDDVGMLAKLAEALRVYARDVQLSRAQDKLLEETVNASIACFTKALRLLPKSGVTAIDQAKQNAWLLAHRGAARMMVYWLGFAQEPANVDDSLFKLCDRDFSEASERHAGQYTWSIQFHAFLHALRGAPGDFDKAVALLESLDEKTLARPTIQRSIAMLYSYNAAVPSASRADRDEAARASINAALKAQKADQDEFLGAYSGAVSSWARFDMSLNDAANGERQSLLKAAQASYETAEIRTRNAISQALVALVGLSFIRGKLALATNDDAAFEAAVQESEWLQGLIQGSNFRDLESRAMVIRDPVWQAILDDQACSDRFKKPGFDELRQSYPPRLDCRGF